MLLRSSIYLYTVDNLRDGANLDDFILEHSNKYKIALKRKISISNYANLALKLNKEGYDISKLKFTSRGKPYLDDVFISLAHTDSLYGFMLSDSECGLDIEGLILEKRFSLANRILNANELIEFNNSSNKALYLTKSWTAKEAYSKMTGEGLNEKIYKLDLNKNSFTVNNMVISYFTKDLDIDVYLNDEMILVDKI